MNVWTRISIPAGPHGRTVTCWVRMPLPGAHGRRLAGGILAMRGQRSVPTPP